MPVIAILGAQWGDEGKGKVVDQLAEKAQMVVRFSGGDNAGHTVINQHGEFKLHIVPSGIFTTAATCIIGNGVVINPGKLIDEIDNLNQRGIDTSRLVISNRAHLVMPYHIRLDGLEEESRAGNAIGTTRRGIGPAFADKSARLGIRIGDLLDKNALLERLRPVLAHKNKILTKVYGAEPLSLDEVYDQLCQQGERLSAYIKDSVVLVQAALSHNELIILEGAQGALLDTDFGTYPYATSSSPLSAGACLGSGIGPLNVDRVLGVYKTYCTRVGSGPFPTELLDETGEKIRQCAHEFGTTTGRPRRCGWFDSVAARFSRQINGFSGMVLTRLDVLDNLSHLKICTAYELGGKKIDYFPAAASDLEKCKPVYEEMEGWLSDTTAIQHFEDLPIEARNYINRLEELTGCQTNIVCVGPSREQSIEVRPVL